MINRVVIVGRLTKDPVLRKTNTNVSVTSFTLAVDNPVAKDSEKTTSFIPCNIWSKGAELVNQYCRKGHQVGVEGRIQQRTYLDKDNRTQSVIEVVCDNVTFLEKKPDDSTTQTPNIKADKSKETSDTTKETESNDDEVVEDDLPF